ncbi:MAG TPA: ABC transporter ATP-binding protein [bacterium]|nr:ABC transporter ATP-binding protein [bacterium]
MIKLENVYKSFRGQRVLDGVSLEIPTGKITVLLGRSGGGKSVTLKHIIGLVRPDSGRILVDGEDITTLDDREMNRVRRNFGVLFQDGALFDSMNIFENIAFPLIEHTKLKHEEIRTTVAEALAAVGLANIEDKLPSELSGGMRKRVGLARAIVLKPQTVFYDEPTSGLDPLMTDSINQLIVDTQKKFNLTNFIISHDVEAALRIADKIAVLYEGKILEEGPPAEIKFSENPFVRAFIEGRQGDYEVL